MSKIISLSDARKKARTKKPDLLEERVTDLETGQDALDERVLRLKKVLAQLAELTNEIKKTLDKRL